MNGLGSCPSARRIALIVLTTLTIGFAIAIPDAAGDEIFSTFGPSTS